MRQHDDPGGPDPELFRLLVEGVREYAIFALTPAGEVASWNAGATRIKGWAAEDILGRHIAVFYPPEDAAAGKPERELRRAAAEGTAEDEGWRVRKDGSRFLASVVITALHDDRGALRGFAKVTRDLTDRRRGEEARRGLAAAREAVRARDDFLAIASHELRTPLTGLRLLVQGVLRGAQPGQLLPELQVERLRQVDRYVSRLDRLIGDLLQVTSLAAGQLPLQRAEFDLGELLREVTAPWREEALRRGGALELVSGGPLRGRWDGARLAEALDAVVGNAVKFAGTAPIAVRVGGEGGRAVVEVEDRGPGIAPEDQARVFERFERAVPVTHHGGFGIGLWAARQIVSAHGGEIEIRSSPGQGSTFTLRLPLG
ncbi:MAG: PAS domain-containing sensor histidine kinase [Anaeromyxobacter sp.]